MIPEGSAVPHRTSLVTSFHRQKARDQDGADKGVFPLRPYPHSKVLWGQHEVHLEPTCYLGIEHIWDESGRTTHKMDEPVG